MNIMNNHLDCSDWCVDSSATAVLADINMYYVHFSFV